MTISIKGYDVIIDDEDFEKVNACGWCARTNEKKGHPEQVYFRATSNNQKKTLHRIILGLKDGDRKIVDHINGNTLDNRKSNLRICSQSENCCNRKKAKTNTSGYKGVNFKKQTGKFVARIGRNGKRLFLGYFDTAEEAHIAYCEASKSYHGEYGRTE